MNIIEFFKKKKKLSREEWLKLPPAKTFIIRPANNGKTQWPLVRSEQVSQVILNKVTN